ncbi:MAG TPA: hypothetical protein ENF22_07750, partial [Chloroflexi bacterium]|nr:hypothetical protein [Chloroflexota bacterium]
MMEEYSPTPDIISFSSHNKIEILSPKEIKTLKKGTYQLLAEVGVYYPSEKALKIFADHGADVNWDSSIVRIPPELVDKALATA